MIQILKDVTANESLREIRKLFGQEADIRVLMREVTIVGKDIDDITVKEEELEFIELQHSVVTTLRKT